MMTMGRLIRLPATAAALLALAAAVFAGGAEEGAQAADQAAPEAMAGAGMTFDHEWDSLRTFVTVSEYTRQTGNAVGDYHEAPELAARVADGSLEPVADRLPADPALVVPYHEIGQYGGTAFIGRMSRLNWSDAQMIGISYEPVTRLASDHRTVLCNVCEAWQISADAQTVTIHLRPGMHWSDGDGFDADDLMFWYQDVMLNEELTPRQPRRWAPGGSFVQVNKVDDHTVTLNFAAPFPNWAPSMATTMGGDMLLPRHYLEGFHPGYTDRGKLEARAKEEGFDSWTKYFGQTRQSWATIVPRYNPDLPTILPFYLTEYSTDVSQWRRNPYYWKVDPAGNQLPYMERIVVTNVEDLEVWNGKTLAGEYTMSGFLTSVEDFGLFKENEETGDYRVINWPTAFAAAANYQPNLTAADADLRPVFQDVRFRRALSLAINRDEINQVVFFGLGESAQMTLLPTSKYYEESFAQAWAEYDPDAANALLDEMGLAWDARNEYRLLPNGKRLSFTVEYINVETPKTRVSELVAEHWAAIGVEAILKEEGRRLVNERVAANQISFSLAHGFGSNDLHFESGRMQWFVPTSVGWANPWAVEWGRWYQTGGAEGEEPPAEIQELQRLRDQFLIEPDEAERIRIGKQILQSQADNLWTIGTVRLIPQPLVIKNSVGNFPERGLWGYSVIWTFPHHPEQFYLKQ